MTTAPLTRERYAVIGGILMGVKYNLDRLVAGSWNRPWSLETYLLPGAGRPLYAVVGDGADVGFYRTMLLIALPFIAVGVWLTIRRLRDAALNGAWAFLFFVPFVNLLFFTLLCVAPSRSVDLHGPFRHLWLSAIIPRNVWGSGAVAVCLVTVPSLLVVAVGANVLQTYGWSLFVGVPFGVGFASALLHSYHEPRSLWQCIVASGVSITLMGVLLLITAVEGAICVLMAAPLGYGLGLIGSIFGYAVASARWRGVDKSIALLAVLITLPALMGAEWAFPLEAPVHIVRTAVDVNAPPAAVWKHVVAFSRIAPPTEPIFKTGIAYPIEARINGKGVGAIRYCQFTTGAFVEPITEWTEPTRLAFSVRSQPPPMQEWSPYASIEPAHLYDYLTSERGQFDLTPLPNGGTHLQGTTWYRHRLWPLPYWMPISDHVLHAIHRRVLEHVKREAEQQHRPEGHP